MNTPIRRFRADDELWTEFQALCAKRGANASAYLRQFMHLMVQEERACPGGQITLIPHTVPVVADHADNELTQEFRTVCEQNGTTASEQQRADMRLYLALNSIRDADNN